jgi:hypothetical protein
VQWRLFADDDYPVKEEGNVCHNVDEERFLDPTAQWTMKHSIYRSTSEVAVTFAVDAVRKNDTGMDLYWNIFK